MKRQQHGKELEVGQCGSGVPSLAAVLEILPSLSCRLMRGGSCSCLLCLTWAMRMSDLPVDLMQRKEARWVPQNKTSRCSSVRSSGLPVPRKGVGVDGFSNDGRYQEQEHLWQRFFSGPYHLVGQQTRLRRAPVRLTCGELGSDRSGCLSFELA